jgi:aspartyl protease family protein
MAFSSGSRQAATVAVGWAVAAVCLAAGITYSSEIRSLAHVLVGLDPDAPARAASEPRKTQSDRHRAASAGRTVELKAGAYGHFHVGAEINGRLVNVMVDSGASIVALTYEDAIAAGLRVRDSDFTHRVNTANGMARVAPVTIDRVTIGDITVRDVPGAVMEAGKLGTTLLGMSFLSRLQRVDMRSGMLVLQE